MNTATLWTPSLTIRRLEYFVAELPILVIPALLVARPAALASTTFLEMTVLFFLLFNLGDMANCLSDVELDEVHKPHLSRAVRALGARAVLAQIALSGLAALGLAAHLGWRSGDLLVPGLVLAGIPLGAAYSLEPVRFKRRGLLHLACQWAVLFLGPMLLTAIAMGERRPWLVLGFALAFGALQEALLLVNCAEDFPEDTAHGVRTTIVALGLSGGLELAVRLATVGALGLLTLLAALSRGRWAPLVLPALVYPTAVAWLASVRPTVPAIRRQAKYVPAVVTAVAWTTALTVWLVR